MTENRSPIVAVEVEFQKWVFVGGTYLVREEFAKAGAIFDQEKFWAHVYIGEEIPEALKELCLTIIPHAYSR